MEQVEEEEVGRVEGSRFLPEVWTSLWQRLKNVAVLCPCQRGEPTGS